MTLWGLWNVLATFWATASERKPWASHGRDDTAIYYVERHGCRCSMSQSMSDRLWQWRCSQRNVPVASVCCSHFMLQEQKWNVNRIPLQRPWRQRQNRVGLIKITFICNIIRIWKPWAIYYPWSCHSLGVTWLSSGEFYCLAIFMTRERERMRRRRRRKKIPKKCHFNSFILV